MKVLLLTLALCILNVSSFQDDGGMDKRKSIQTRPLHKPETQNNPVVVPVPVYTPVQQYPQFQQMPIQQYPQIQPIPVQQYPAIQQIPVQQYPYVPIQQYPLPHPQYQHHPHGFSHHRNPHFYPQNFQGIPC